MSADTLERRSAWRVMVPPLVFAAVVLASLAVRFSTGDTAFAALVLSGGVGLVALWAVLDGLARLLGRSTFLGIGRGIDRLIGLIQVGASASVALALLPNAVALLEFLARLAL